MRFRASQDDTGDAISRQDVVSQGGQTGWNADGFAAVEKRRAAVAAEVRAAKATLYEDPEFDILETASAAIETRLQRTGILPRETVRAVALAISRLEDRYGGIGLPAAGDIGAAARRVYAAAREALPGMLADLATQKTETRRLFAPPADARPPAAGLSVRVALLLGAVLGAGLAVLLTFLALAV